MQNQKNDVAINIRVHSRVRDFIDRAANSIGKTRTAFVVEAACERAEEVLMDRTLFALTDSQWNEFNRALNNPPKPDKKLLALLATKSPRD